MAISLFDLFKVGIGPSSSHTVGPMVAAYQFVHFLEDEQILPQVKRVMCELYGSLGATGKGHGTGKAVLMGLEGELPDSINPDSVDPRVEAIETGLQISLNAKHQVPFEPSTDLIYHRIDRLDFHANGMTLRAYDESQNLICEKTYYSVGGGFIVNENDQGEVKLVEDDTQLTYDFHSSEELLKLCKEHDLSIAQIMLENEKAWRTE